jgi:hypothetical protein
MKWTIFFVVFLVAVNRGNGQKQLFLKTSDENYQLNIASAEVNKIFIPARFNETELKSGVKKSEINVTFINFPQEAKTAFLYAAGIWESIISSNIPINILATWEEMDDNIVSKSRPSLNFRTFEGAPVQDVYYPVSLVEKLTGQEMNKGEPDIFCSFNKNMPWYFKTDGYTPEFKYDFVSAVLHEITHGIGFYGFLKDNNGEGFFNNAANLPSIYDYFIFNEYNQQISDKNIFNSPSKELHVQLTSEKLKLYQPRTFSQNQDILDWIYAPKAWKDGVSIYHFRENSEIVQLMSAETKKGEAIHYPDEFTLKVLYEIGWKSVSFDFNEIKDFEVPVASLPVEIGIVTDIEIDSSQLFLIYTKDNFISYYAVKLNYNAETSKFVGNLPLNFYQGNIKYYFSCQTIENRIYKFPASAPDKFLSFRVGPDYYPPEIFHNPSKMLNAKNNKLVLKAQANDNIGIKNVTVEYKIDGIMQVPVEMKNDSSNFFSINLQLPANINKNTKFEYRLIAKDISQLQNKSAKPQIGFIPVEIFETLSPVYNYYNNFNTSTSDFSLSDFTVSKPVLFDNGNLHTVIPYQNSEIEKEYNNHIALLKHPVILRANGKLEFDEIVLVEPGESGTDFTNRYFWDYVIIEGSKDFGNLWYPLTDGYDSQKNEIWETEFKSALINNTSLAAGTSKIFTRNSVNLTNNRFFSAGDTILIRFRLAADNSVNGWGWAIDNIEIQQSVTGIKELVAANSLKIYPNPVNDILHIDLSVDAFSGYDKTEIIITDILGKKVLQFIPEKEVFSSTLNIDLGSLNKGLYFINISTGQNESVSGKIIKN